MQPASSKSAQVPDSMDKSRAEWERVPDSNALGQRTLEHVGSTPLLRLERVARDLPNIQLLGKAEWMNPGGSVKDRAAANIVTEARAAGRLGPGKILLDSTSGNTGIAYAMIGAAQGFPVTLCMPENVSPERKHILPFTGLKGRSTWRPRLCPRFAMLRLPMRISVSRLKTRMPWSASSRERKGCSSEYQQERPWLAASRWRGRWEKISRRCL